jgi:hypothetical protein
MIQQLASEKEERKHNKDLAKAAVQCSSDTFVVKIDTIAKLEKINKLKTPSYN